GMGILVACGSSEGSNSSVEGASGEAAETTTGAAPSQGDAPAAAASLRMQQDLLEMAHLADVEHHGLYIDFGTPARMKYTIGHWRTGWGSDGADGDETFTNASEMGRIYFPVREPGPLTLR